MTYSRSNKSSAEKTVGDIRRAPRRNYSVKEKIRIVLEGLRAEESIAALCRRLLLCRRLRTGLYLICRH